MTGTETRSAAAQKADPLIGSVSPANLMAMLGDGEELAVLDVREELIFSQNHLLHARSAPLSRLELRVPQLAPRPANPYRAGG